MLNKACQFALNFTNLEKSLMVKGADRPGVWSNTVADPGFPVGGACTH